ncbi:MAG TPA: hybrid sensor histidine kinase/response regulator [Cyanobacteria bacterium UBA8803]|nr:hybrid sensor histidine kinase/response regulator [Cyanobacteria bacterium UBA9273]HBL57862.1 hybrid sensor histidine kinase/response regulator [Cyanobacteria bacterium UBA8803]
MVTAQAPSILIVDDTPNNIRVLFDILDRAGFNLAVVKSGEMALEKLPLIQPDLILLDIMMPGMDGFETCRRLKADPTSKDIPIIFMTVLSDLESKVKGLQMGAVDYITKPIQVEEVMARVNVHLALRTAQIQLMNEVSERRQAEERLKQTLQELQKTQTQLIQSEKMSALGQLVAGVAHEINNPVNFIGGNLSHAREYTQDLLNLVQLYEEHYPQPVPEVLAEIEAMEWDFLREDLPKLINSMQVGVDRLQQILLSLRIFSRTDETEMKLADLHQGLDSTLMILGYRLKAHSERPAIDIIKKYGNLPLVECYSGQLNQVFMNILSNAIDGLEQAIHSHKKFAPAITIQTEAVEGDRVAIRIIDNGWGIPPEVQKRIFEPFFTTKPVDKGTGLGLAISYQIVAEKHQGSLQCVSELGQGSEFAILIPLQQG